MPLRGREFRSTGLAIFPLDGWLVKVRISSTELDPEQLAARLDAFLAALSYEARGTTPPATVMADCVKPLRFRNARRAAPPGLGTQLILSALSGIVEEKAQEAGNDVPAAPERFCRDAATKPDFGVYRHEGADDAYIIALGDAGVSAAVHRQPAAGLLGGSGGRDFWIYLSTIYETYTYRGFRSLPRPDQVVEVIETEHPATSVKRDGNGNTTINLGDG